MEPSTKRVVVIGALSLLALGPAMVAAHPRNYVNTGLEPAPLLTCLDSAPFEGLDYNPVQLLLGHVVRVLDPYAPDVNGSCWRAGHIQPGPDGTVTFSLHDAVQGEVGACLAQDRDGDGQICPDADDVEVLFCNQVTVAAGAGPHAFLFDRFRTWVVLDRVLPLHPPHCGVGPPSTGTTGFIDHT